MKITEITRPDFISNAKQILVQHGYKELGHGAFATVFAKPDEPFVLKLFATYDSAYLQFLKLIVRVHNPHFPIVKGKPIKVTNQYWAARLERLEPIEGSNNQLHLYAKQYIYCYQELANLEKEYYDNRMYGQGHFPDDKFMSTKIHEIRTKILAFEHHYPDLAEALRLIEKYVLNGDTPDLHAENVMQRGSTLVITDPSCGGPEGTLDFNKSPNQPDLFQTKPQKWNDKLKQYNYDKLNHNLPQIEPDLYPRNQLKLKLPDLPM